LRFAGILASFFAWFLACAVCDKLMSEWHRKPLPKHTLLILIRLQFEVITESGKTPPNLISSFTEIEIFSDWHTSKPGPDSDSDPDLHSKKIRTREKPGPGLEKNPDSCLKKPGLDFWKPGLEIEKTGFKTRTLWMQRFFGKV
jgi:hypothetical protein